MFLVLLHIVRIAIAKLVQIRQLKSSHLVDITDAIGFGCDKLLIYLISQEPNGNQHIFNEVQLMRSELAAEGLIYVVSDFQYPKLLSLISELVLNAQIMHKKGVDSWIIYNTFGHIWQLYLTSQKLFGGEIAKYYDKWLDILQCIYQVANLIDQIKQSSLFVYISAAYSEKLLETSQKAMPEVPLPKGKVSGKDQLKQSEDICKLAMECSGANTASMLANIQVWSKIQSLKLSTGGNISVGLDLDDEFYQMVLLLDSNAALGKKDLDSTLGEMCVRVYYNSPNIPTIFLLEGGLKVVQILINARYFELADGIVSKMLPIISQIRSLSVCFGEDFENVILVLCSGFTWQPFRSQIARMRLTHI